MCSLVPSSGPVLCRDEMEEWSASEANLFEDALEKYGKDFNDIRNDFVSSTYQRRNSRPAMAVVLFFNTQILQVTRINFTDESLPTNSYPGRPSKA